MSVASECSSGEWLTPPARLRTKSIPLGIPAWARMPAFVAAAGRQIYERLAAAKVIRECVRTLHIHGVVGMGHGIGAL